MGISEVTPLVNSSPKQNTVKASQIFGDYLVMLIAPCVMAVWHYGMSSVYVIAVSVLSALVCDFCMSAIIRKKFLLKDFSCIYIGASIALMLPAGVPLYVPIFASSFAVLAVKTPFGGALRSPFVPAAAGFAFASVCFKEQVFTFTQSTETKFLGERSLGSLLSQGNSVHLNAANVFDIISGNVAGPMGTGCGIVMLGCCAYLFVRRRRALFATAGFIASCAVFAMIFPRINASAITSLVLELSSGSLMFAAVFLVTDYATLPKKSLNRVVYGAVCGAICMSMRYVGVYEETVCFAVLLANGLRPVIDSALKNLPSLPKREKAERPKTEKGAAEK